MKDIFRKLMLRIKLAYIAWFVSGALIVEAINYLIFKNSITPSGVSSTIAAMALAFSIYAAFRVKKWSETKVNDKAFVQTDLVISSISQTLLLCSELKSQLLLLSTAKHIDLISISREKRSIINEKKYNIAQKMMDINLILLSLKMWKCSTTDEAREIIGIISKKLVSGQLNITTFNIMLDKNDNDILLAGLASHVYESINQINDTLIHFQDFFGLGYNKAFIHHEK